MTKKSKPKPIVLKDLSEIKEAIRQKEREFIQTINKPKT